MQLRYPRANGQSETQRLALRHRSRSMMSCIFSDDRHALAEVRLLLSDRWRSGCCRYVCRPRSAHFASLLCSSEVLLRRVNHRNILGMPDLTSTRAGIALPVRLQMAGANRHRH